MTRGGLPSLATGVSNSATRVLFVLVVACSSFRTGEGLRLSLKQSGADRNAVSHLCLAVQVEHQHFPFQPCVRAVLSQGELKHTCVRDSLLIDSFRLGLEGGLERQVMASASVKSVQQRPSKAWRGKWGSDFVKLAFRMMSGRRKIDMHPVPKGRLSVHVLVCLARDEVELLQVRSLSSRPAGTALVYIYIYIFINYI